jgi:hypothetical protein
MCFYKIVKNVFSSAKICHFHTKLKKYFNKNIDGHDTIMTGRCHDDQVSAAIGKHVKDSPF